MVHFAIPLILTSNVLKTSLPSISFIKSVYIPPSPWLDNIHKCCLWSWSVRYDMEEAEQASVIPLLGLIKQHKLTLLHTAKDLSDPGLIYLCAKAIKSVSQKKNSIINVCPPTAILFFDAGSFARLTLIESRSTHPEMMITLIKTSCQMKFFCYWNCDLKFQLLHFLFPACTLVALYRAVLGPGLHRT